MALTKSAIADTTFGNLHVKVIDVTPDAAATSVATGMQNIQWSQVTIASGVTDATFGVFTENEGPAGTSIAGEFAMTSVVTSGEIKYRIVLYGSA